MKKFCFISILAGVFILTGCSMHQTVNDYSKAMNAKVSANNSYTITAKQTDSNKEIYYKSFIKGQKWKTLVSTNGGASYMSYILYDGKDLLTYTQGSRYALVNPIIDKINNEDPEIKMLTINFQNPVYPLLNWNNGYGLLGIQEADIPEFTNEHDSRNGFDCRMIKFGEDRETCVNDKYGVAVYQEMKFNDIMHLGKKKVITINLLKIDTSEIDDSVFELPKGVRKMDMDAMIDNVSNLFKKLN